MATIATSWAEELKIYKKQKAELPSTSNYIESLKNVKQKSAPKAYVAPFSSEQIKYIQKKKRREGKKTKKDELSRNKKLYHLQNSSYNIITHENRGQAARSSEKDFSKAGTGIHGTTTVKTEAEMRAHESRPFNIVSNRYYQNHEEKAKDEARLSKKYSKDKICNQLVYDPVRGIMYNPLLEKYVQREEKKQFDTHVERSFKRLPQVIKNSSGHSYDIISLEVKNPERMKIINEQSEQHASSKMKYEFEKKIIEKREAHENGLDQMRLIRLKENKSRERDFDIIYDKTLSKRAGLPVNKFAFDSMKKHQNVNN